jgi:hypothetical protein
MIKYAYIDSLSKPWYMRPKALDIKKVDSTKDEIRLILSLKL